MICESRTSARIWIGCSHKACQPNRLLRYLLHHSANYDLMWVFQLQMDTKWLRCLLQWCWLDFGRRLLTYQSSNAGNTQYDALYSQVPPIRQSKDQLQRKGLFVTKSYHYDIDWSYQFLGLNTTAAVVSFSNYSTIWFKSYWSPRPELGL